MEARLHRAQAISHVDMELREDPTMIGITVPVLTLCRGQPAQSMTAAARHVSVSDSFNAAGGPNGNFPNPKRMTAQQQPQVRNQGAERREGGRGRRAGR